VNEHLAGGNDLRNAKDVFHVAQQFIQHCVPRAHCTLLLFDGAFGNAGPRRLSDRELELFQLLGRGLGSSEIANAMGLSVKTVEGYEACIQNKLDLESATTLSHFAADWYRGANH
jgi:DNA-binding NarL/FixJ family response regulator